MVLWIQRVSLYKTSVANNIQGDEMRKLRIAVYAAMMIGSASQAFALDLTTYPENVLGLKSNAKASVAKGTVVCKLTGMFYSSGSPVNYSGHVKLTHVGIQDSDGFGRFSSPAGNASFVQYNVPYSTPDGNGGYTEGGVTCVHLLNTTDSKYAVNRFGVGVSELHWDADANNSNTCPAFVDQMSWVMDKAGHAITTKINDTPTTIRGEQSVECYKSN
jgi:hypothetical protein